MNTVLTHFRVVRLGMVAEFCLLLLVLLMRPTSASAASGSGYIEDDAHVLSVAQVSQGAQAFPYELDIYTTTTFTGDAGLLSTFARQHISTTQSGIVVLFIDARQHHVALVGNSRVSFTDQQYRTAIGAFAQAYQQHHSYTDATLAVIHALARKANTNVWIDLIILVIVLLVIIGICCVTRGGSNSTIVIWSNTDDAGSGSDGGGAIGSF